MKTGRPVADELKARLPVTVELSALSLLVALAIAVPAGVISAMRQNTWVDYAVRAFSIAGLAMPIMWTGTLIIIFLTVWFRWLPPLGFSSIFDNPARNLQQMAWPSLTLGYLLAAVIARMTRSCMLDVLRQDYIRTAWAKGLRERSVLYGHALKNAMLPVVTVVGLQFGQLLGGAVIVETIFVLPGIGSLLVESILFRDYPVVQTIVLTVATAFVLINIAVDALYAWLDPRIKYA